MPVEDWPSVTGAAVILTEEWDYPEPATTDSADGDSEEETAEDAEEEDPEPVKVFTATWVVTDVEATGLVYGSRSHGCASGTESGTGSHGADATRAEAEAEAKRKERRTVIANNKTWVSAETVRRDWLAGFLTRKSAPKGAEALICEAVLTGNYAEQGDGPPAPDAVQVARHRRAERLLRRGLRGVPEDRDEGHHAQGARP